MDLVTDSIDVPTRGDSHMVDLSVRVQEAVHRHGFREGQALVFVPGSTAGLTTIEFEPGLQKDFPRAMERIAPSGEHYDHDARWGDGNGLSHVRASTIGPGIVVPFKDKMMLLGTWQQVVLVDFDTRPRKRNVIVQVLG